jgi:hypothetical protein
VRGAPGGGEARIAQDAHQLFADLVREARRARDDHDEVGCAGVALARERDARLEQGAEGRHRGRIVQDGEEEVAGDAETKDGVIVDDLGSRHGSGA